MSNHGGRGDKLIHKVSDVLYDVEFCFWKKVTHSTKTIEDAEYYNFNVFFIDTYIQHAKNKITYSVHTFESTVHPLHIHIFLPTITVETFISH